jgi:chromosome segregation ATPase
VDPDVLRLQQEEIATLRENIYVLNEQVNSLQVSMHEQNQRAEQLNSTVGSIQVSFHEQQVSQTNLSLAISELKDNNQSLKSDISVVMLMLSKMDSTLSSLSVQSSPPSTLRSGEASQDRPATC